MSNNIYDLIIIGAGPAGMTAGIYAGRKEMKTLILSKDVGGQMAKTAIIENHPGEIITDGVALAFKIKEQVEKTGVDFETQTIKSIKSTKDDMFEVESESGQKYITKSVILAFGLARRKLGLDNEKDFEGKGLVYCVTCDGPLFKDKPVAVVGASNAGAEAAEFLAKICPKVYWIEMTDKINADKILADRVTKLKNVKVLLSSQITELVGESKLERIILRQAQGDTSLEVSGLFVEIGYVPQSEWIKDLVALDKGGQIKINELCQTNVPGIFAAGDCATTKYKQIVIAEGEGATAALEAYEYINKISKL